MNEHDSDQSDQIVPPDHDAPELDPEATSPEQGTSPTPAAENGPEGDEEFERPAPEDIAATAEDFVRGLLGSMGLEGEISSRVEGEAAYVDIEGESLGILIGRRGQTLDALQEVARTAVQRRLRSRIRLTVDVESYRARRRASLADYAREMAARAKERGTEIELEPMPAYERKIVHDAVSEVEGASSYSEGEDPHRKVVIRGE